ADRRSPGRGRPRPLLALRREGKADRGPRQRDARHRIVWEGLGAFARSAALPPLPPVQAPLRHGSGGPPTRMGRASESVLLRRARVGMVAEATRARGWRSLVTDQRVAGS